MEEISPQKNWDFARRLKSVVKKLTISFIIVSSNIYLSIYIIAAINIIANSLEAIFLLFIISFFFKDFFVLLLQEEEERRWDNDKATVIEF